MRKLLFAWVWWILGATCVLFGLWVWQRRTFPPTSPIDISEE